MEKSLNNQVDNIAQLISISLLPLVTQVLLKLIYKQSSHCGKGEVPIYMRLLTKIDVTVVLL